MPSIEKEPIYDVYCISRRQYQRFLNILFRDVSVAQLVASVSGVVLGSVAKVVGSNVARGKIFIASIGSVDSLYPSLYIYIYIPHQRRHVDEKGYLDLQIKFKVAVFGDGSGFVVANIYDRSNL